MFARTVLGLTAVLLVGTAVAARADGPVPPAFKSLRPYQVVEQIMAQREVLSLTDRQFARLDDLTIAIRTEQHSFTHQGGKPHNTQHVPMITRQQAYDEALNNPTPTDLTFIGNKGGGTRPVFSDSYAARLAALEHAVKQAEEELKRAEGG